MKKTPKASSPAAAKRKASRRKAAPAARQASPPSARLAALAPKREPSGTDAAAHAKATIRRLKSQLAAAQARIEQLEASADIDFLLGILNRRGFERELNRSVAYIRRYHASGALIVLDVDRLKPINDAFGHAAGDAVLKAVVAALSRHVRSSDLIGRLGGDEFAMLLWNLSETDARAKAASLEETIDRLTFTFRGRTVSAGASAGVAILGPHAEAGTALEQADSAMYVRKAQRRQQAS
ncbi:MAG: diguanylate cyclase [Proteobacteria bacterium]|nr:diguanylate cyclase [Pseudomonadota bacterium]